MKATKSPVDLSALTVEQFWSLPIHGDQYDYDFKLAAEQILDSKEAKQLSKNTGLNYDIAKFIFALVGDTFGDDKDRYAEEYTADIQEFIYQATRYLQIKDLLNSKNKSTRHLAEDYIGTRQNEGFIPKNFLIHRLRNMTLFFSTILLLEFAASFITDNTRSSTMITVGTIGVLGVWNYAFLPRRYYAVRELYSYLKERDYV